MLTRHAASVPVQRHARLQGCDRVLSWTLLSCRGGDARTMAGEARWRRRLQARTQRRECARPCSQHQPLLTAGRTAARPGKARAIKRPDAQSCARASGSPASSAGGLPAANTGRSMACRRAPRACCARRLASLEAARGVRSAAPWTNSHMLWAAPSKEAGVPARKLLGSHWCHQVPNREA
jgi:hypothetical protein